MPSKYTPLEQYLKNQPYTIHELTLTFGRIEEILADSLPKSASIYPEWWNNEEQGTHVQARSWMDAGWRVVTANLSQRSVRFFRA